MKLINKCTLEGFIDANEDELLSRWDEYKYDKYCELNRGHKDDVYKSYPVSLMNTFVISGQLFNNVMHKYMHELKVGGERQVIDYINTL
jgi:hypothetical protein